MTTMTYSETLVVTSCWCGIAHAIPENLHTWARQSGRNAVHCPLGHEYIFNDNFEKKLKREQQAHAATRDLLHAEERSHTATRGHLTRTKKRVAAGVCPCCHRTFQQLSRHMANKHPDYAGESS